MRLCIQLNLFRFGVSLSELQQNVPLDALFSIFGKNNYSHQEIFHQLAVIKFLQQIKIICTCENMTRD